MQQVRRDEGKLVRKVSVAATQPSVKTKSPRLFVKETRSGVLFLVDTGSDVSVIPTSSIPRRNNYEKVPYQLRAANDVEIKTYGSEICTLDLGMAKKYSWNFVVADVSVPILGADFLKFFHLLPDLRRNRLFDGTTLVSTVCELLASKQASVNAITGDRLHENAKIDELLRKYPSLLKPPQYFTKPPHDVEHHIETTGPPIYQKPRRMRPEIAKEFRTEVEKNLASGLISHSKSQWASPVVPIWKRGKIRIAGDFRLLNGRTIPDRFPMSDMRDSTLQLRGKRVFSNVDIVRAYFNIPIYIPDRPKTALSSCVGLFEYNRMPLGLRNAPATFQRFMQSILGDLPFIFIYLDDILVASDTLDEHYRHLEIIFSRLAEYGLTLNINKSCFASPEVCFLGRRITQDGFLPTEERVEFIRNLKRPRTIEALRSVIGTFGFYREFKRQAAAVLAPLNGVLKGRTKRRDKTPVNWTPELVEAFEKAKELFSSFTLLHYPCEDATLVLSADASGVAVGASLDQINDDGIREPLGFFSKKLDENEQNWPAYDRELYALYAAADYFEHLIEGRRLILVTDHKPLLGAFTSQKRCKIQRRSHQLQYLSQFTNEIVHISGADNIVADQLSRPEVGAIAESSIENFDFTLRAFAEAQRNDDEIQVIRADGLRDHDIGELFDDDRSSILCSVYNGEYRPLVPKLLRHTIFKKLHEVAHPGLKATQRLIGRRYFWPGFKRDVRTWHRTCHECQKSKVTRHTKAPVSSFPPSDRFEHLHMDIVVLKSTSEGYRYLCTFVDRGSRWIEAVPLRDITAETVARAFVEQWVARYGVPAYLTTDRGAQFTSALFSEVAIMLGSQQLKTTAYNPRANGAVERMHRRLKDALKCRGGDWVNVLPAVLLGMRSSPRDDSGISCAEMTFGKTLRLPGEIFTSAQITPSNHIYVTELREAFRKIRPASFRQKKDRVFVHPDLTDCKRVYVRVDRVKAPLEPPYDGPFLVLKRTKKWFTVDVNGRNEDINIDRLKPAYQLADDEDDHTNQEVGKNRAQVLESGKLYNESKIDLDTKKNTRLNRCSVYVRQPAKINPADVPLPPSPPLDPAAIPLPPSPIAGGQHQGGILIDHRTRSGRAVRKPVRFKF